MIMNTIEENQPKPKKIFLTYNTNGLRTGDKRDKILNSLDPNAFCFLQETHSLPGDNWQMEWSGPSLWSSHTNFSAGTAILLPKSTQIQQHVLDTEGRYVLAKITHFGKPYTLCCVYAPDKPYQRPKFWTNLKRQISLLKPVGETILAGDFNSVLDPSTDRDGGNPNLPQHTCGNAELEEILDELCLADPCDTQSVGFTWKSEAKHVKSRLDRIYINQDSINRVQGATKRYLPYSDHAMLSLEMSVQAGAHRSAYWKLNTSILSDQLYQERIEADIICHQRAKESQNLSQWWDDAKLRFRETSIIMCKRRSKTAKARRAEILNALSQPNLPREREEDLNQELLELNENQNKGAQIRSRAKLAEDFETPNHYFFAVEKQRGEKKHISSLKVGDKTLNTPTEINAHITQTYSGIFSQHEYDPPAAEEILQHVPNRLGEDGLDSLTTPVTKKEVEEAVRSCSKNSAPGLDGLPYEFYRAFLNVLSDDLVEVFNYCLFDAKSLTDTMRRAVITLIPKKGDTEDLNNWRPISLQNCDSKILAKIIANRLRPNLETLTSVSQACSVPGRQIQDHTILVREIITYANHKRIPTFIVSVDQEKAFDKVSWEFMFEVLRRLGLPEGFIEMVKVLYSNPESCFNINGELTPFILIRRGVRQGCPLSLLLYILVAEALGLAIRACPDIKGFKMPGYDPIPVLQYADDTNLIVQNIKSINAALRIFDIYCKATGCNLKPDKTKGLAIATNEHLTAQTLHRVQWNERFTVLGIRFTPDQLRNYALNWGDVISKAEKASNALAKRSLSLRGRALVCNTLVLSKTWHVARVYTPNKQQCARLLAICAKYIWQNEHEKIARDILSIPIAKGGLNLLPILDQALSLQISDMLRITCQPQPLWAGLAKYWLADSLRSLKPEWRKLLGNNAPKFVIGMKPLQHALIMPPLKLFCKSNSKTQSVRTIRTVLTSSAKIQVPGRHARDLFHKTESEWKQIFKHDFQTLGKPRHANTRFLFLHNALPSLQNIQKWSRNRNANLGCKLCGQTETTPHIFECPGRFTVWTECILALHPKIKMETSPIGLITNPPNDVFIQTLVHETTHQIWLARNKLLYEDVHTSNQSILAKITSNLSQIEFEAKSKLKTKEIIQQIVEYI